MCLCVCMTTWTIQERFHTHDNFGHENMCIGSHPTGRPPAEPPPKPPPASAPPASAPRPRRRSRRAFWSSSRSPPGGASSRRSRPWFPLRPWFPCPSGLRAHGFVRFSCGRGCSRGRRVVLFGNYMVWVAVFRSSVSAREVF